MAVQDAIKNGLVFRSCQPDFAHMRIDAGAPPRSRRDALLGHFVQVIFEIKHRIPKSGEEVKCT